MRMLPRSARGTWLVAGATWAAGCAGIWWIMPPHPRATITVAGAQWPCAFSPDGKWLVTESANADGSSQLRVWDASTGRSAPHLPQLPTHEAGSARITFSPDGRWLLFFAATRAVGEQYVLMDLRTGRHTTKSALTTSASPAFSPTELIVAVAEYEGEGACPVRLLELPTLRRTAELAGAQGPVAYSPDGRILATGGVDSASGEPLRVQAQRVLLWDAATTRVIATLPLPNAPVGPSGLRFTPDGRRLVVDTRAGVGFTARNDPSTVVVWDVPARRELFRLADEWLLFINGDDSLITTSGEAIRARELVTGGVRYSVNRAFMLEGLPVGNEVGPWVMGVGEDLSILDRCRGWLANQGLPVPGVVGDRPFVCVIDPATGQDVARLRGVQAPVQSADGKTLAVMTNELTELWDLPLRPSRARFALAAAVLALPLAGLAWRRSRRLRREVA
jgi:WD40 repeat protein